jgi:hypothetical protein
MNKYGRLAIRHWERIDPDRYRQIPDPEAFFSELGERAEIEIQELQDALAGPDPAEETYVEKVGRLNMARLQAEERVLAELILIPESTSRVDEWLGENEPARWYVEMMRERTRMRQADE